jgi:hypothetical protein
VPRLVKVSLWQLTDQELDDLAAAADATNPARASELRQLKTWRRDHPLPAVFTNATGCTWSCDELDQERLIEPAVTNTGSNPQRKLIPAE